MSGQLIATSNMALPEGSYIYHILPFRSHLAAISSDDSLRLIDPTTLRAIPNGEFSNVHAGITCMTTPRRSSDVLMTAGRDAKVKGWDVRVSVQTTNFQDSIAPGHVFSSTANTGLANIPFDRWQRLVPVTSLQRIICGSGIRVDEPSSRRVDMVNFHETAGTRRKLKFRTGTSESLRAQSVNTWRAIMMT